MEMSALQGNHNGPLSQSLDDWEKQIEILRRSEETFLLLESEEKSLEARLFLGSLAKTIAERQASAYASEAWNNFKRGLSVAEADRNHQKRVLEHKIKQYEARYLELKLEGEYIRKGNL